MLSAFTHPLSLSPSYSPHSSALERVDFFGDPDRMFGIQDPPPPPTKRNPQVLYDDTGGSVGLLRCRAVPFPAHTTSQLSIATAAASSPSAAALAAAAAATTTTTTLLSTAATTEPAASSLAAAAAALAPAAASH
jgi:hypothetical protein